MSPNDEHHVELIKVLIIEANADAGAELIASLEQFGMQAAWGQTGNEGLALKRSFSPDVILVDLQLPDIDGIRLVEILATEGNCGIIIVSGADDETEQIVSLEMGADDYMTKPPRSRELKARIRAVYRRVGMRSVVKTKPVRAVIQVGKLQVDLDSRVVRSEHGDRIALTNAEFAALEMMIAANGKAVTRSRLAETALHRPWRAEDRSVDQLIFCLRHKLSSGGIDRMIHSVRSAGYLLTLGVSHEDQKTALTNIVTVNP
jgi:DNA-binding response OmpR family regulator